MKAQHFEEELAQKDMYVINLDLTRVFWVIAVALFITTFFFLFGYWLGTDSNYQNIETNSNSNKSSVKKWTNFKKEDIDSFSNLKDVKRITNRVLAEKLLEGTGRRHPTKDRGDRTSSSSKGQDVRERGISVSRKERERSNPVNNRIAESRNYSIKSNIGENNKKAQNKEDRNPLPKRRIAGKRDNNLSKKAPYTLQVSTNRIKRNAYRLKEMLRQKGFRSYIFIKETESGDRLYFVRVGPFLSEGKAQETRKKVRILKEGKDSLVVNR